MNNRRGLGKGMGIGYKNLVPLDAHIHSLSAKGFSQKQSKNMDYMIGKSRAVKKGLITENQANKDISRYKKVYDIDAKGKLKTTGKVSYKPYKCTRCGRVQQQQTNHWGDIYPRCEGCSWKNPLDPNPVWECQEPVPKGYKKPEPWKKVKLGDVAEINAKGKKRVRSVMRDAPDIDEIFDGGKYIGKDDTILTGGNFETVEKWKLGDYYYFIGRNKKDGENILLDKVKEGHFSTFAKASWKTIKDIPNYKMWESPTHTIQMWVNPYEVAIHSIKNGVPQKNIAHKTFDTKKQTLTYINNFKKSQVKK